MNVVHSSTYEVVHMYNIATVENVQKAPVFFMWVPIFLPRVVVKSTE